MRKIVILVLALLIVLFMSMIVVDERQSAVISSYDGRQRVELAGIHFTWPLWDSVDYVFTNERTALLSLAVNESVVESKPLQVEVLVNYHVTNPAQYLLSIQKLVKSSISEKIAGILITNLKLRIAANTLDNLNQESMVFIDPAKFKNLGINIDQVSLLNIKFIEMPVAKVNASAPTASIGN